MFAKSGNGEFQFTPLREGRRLHLFFNIFERQFQFTPLREGRREFKPRCGIIVISIHAPPRGATGFGGMNQPIILISIHAPPRGATQLGGTRMRARHNFNSRPSARGDKPTRSGRTNKNISIHAPPRGATGSAMRRTDAHVLFQFTPLREGRHALSPPISPSRYFNSRPSARGDPASKCQIHSLFVFQFTPLREGRLRGQNARRQRHAISIHAPPRGATADVETTENSCNISIHAPPRGATYRYLMLAYIERISIHAPPRGATRANVCIGGRKYFNSRPSARGDNSELPFSLR